jgi:hypothetical protein
MSESDFDTCEKCGSFIGDPEIHERICGSSTPFEDGVCPMCGEGYESYTNHIRDCDGN